MVWKRDRKRRGKWFLLARVGAAKGYLVAPQTWQMDIVNCVFHFEHNQFHIVFTTPREKEQIDVYPVYSIKNFVSMLYISMFRIEFGDVVEGSFISVILLCASFSFLLIKLSESFLRGDRAWSRLTMEILVMRSKVPCRLRSNFQGRGFPKDFH